eukprot:403340969
MSRFTHHRQSNSATFLDKPLQNLQQSDNLQNAKSSMINSSDYDVISNKTPVKLQKANQQLQYQHNNQDFIEKYETLKLPEINVKTQQNQLKSNQIFEFPREYGINNDNQDQSLLKISNLNSLMIGQFVDKNDGSKSQSKSQEKGNNTNRFRKALKEARERSNFLIKNKNGTKVSDQKSLFDLQNLRDVKKQEKLLHQHYTENFQTLVEDHSLIRQVSVTQLPISDQKFQDQLLQQLKDTITTTSITQNQQLHSNRQSKFNKQSLNYSINDQQQDKEEDDSVKDSSKNMSKLPSLIRKQIKQKILESLKAQNSSSKPRNSGKVSKNDTLNDSRHIRINLEGSLAPWDEDYENLSPEFKHSLSPSALQSKFKNFQ